MTNSERNSGRDSTGPLWPATDGFRDPCALGCAAVLLADLGPGERHRRRYRPGSGTAEVRTDLRTDSGRDLDAVSTGGWALYAIPAGVAGAWQADPTAPADDGGGRCRWSARSDRLMNERRRHPALGAIADGHPPLFGGFGRGGHDRLQCGEPLVDSRQALLDRRRTARLPKPVRWAWVRSRSICGERRKAGLAGRCRPSWTTRRSRLDSFAALLRCRTEPGFGLTARTASSSATA